MSFNLLPPTVPSLNRPPLPNTSSPKDKTRLLLNSDTHTSQVFHSQTKQLNRFEWFSLFIFQLSFTRKVPLRLKELLYKAVLAKREHEVWNGLSSSSKIMKKQLHYEVKRKSISSFSIIKPIMFHFSATICFICKAIIVDWTQAMSRLDQMLELFSKSTM